MYELRVRTIMAAAHNLRNFKGKCENLHGHNWLIEVFLTADRLDDAGLVMDFGDVKSHLVEIMEELDHKYLNEVEFFKANNPTSENVARYIYHRLSERLDSSLVRVGKVSAWESENACASYLPEKDLA